MLREYTNTQCKLYGTDYCKLMHMTNCKRCTVACTDEREAARITGALDQLKALMPEDGIADLFITRECVLCKGDRKGKRRYYGMVDLGNPLPRSSRPDTMGFKPKAKAGSIVPVQLAACSRCRRNYLLAGYLPVYLATGFALAALVVMSIRSLREALMAVTYGLPFYVFAGATLLGIILGAALRSSALKKLKNETEFQVMNLPKLKAMAEKGWFELYPQKRVSRLIFTKKRLRAGVYTGPYPCASANGGDQENSVEHVLAEPEAPSANESENI